MVNATFDIEEGVGTITFARKEALNALDVETKRAITKTLREYRDDDSVRVVVFQGAGERSFCTGGDLKEVPDNDYELELFHDTWEEMFSLMTSLGKPTVAKVDGYALGGGFDLLMYTDFVVTADDAKLGVPEVDLGVIDHFSPPLLPHTVGLRKTVELLMLGEPISGHEAERIGLVTRSVPQDEIDDEVDEVVTTLLEKSPQVLRRYKDAIYTSVEMSPTAARAHVRSIAMENDGNDPDVRAGVDAALDNRESD